MPQRSPRPDGLTWQQVDDEVVVLDLEASKYLSFNGAAGVLWNAMADESRSDAELADLLVAAFAIGRDTAERDVRAFVLQCEGLDLLA